MQDQNSVILQQIYSHQLVTDTLMKIKMCEPLVSENAVRVGMAESSLSMDPSLPLQEDSLMMPPPVPNRSVSLGLVH